MLLHSGHGLRQRDMGVEMTMASNGPAFWWELPAEIGDGFGAIMEPMEIVADGDQPCDGCGRIHYTDESACLRLTPPEGDNWAGRYDDNHCGCWYECEPCHWCGDDPVVLYGPKPPRKED